MRLLALGDNVADIYVDQQCAYPGGNAVNVAVSIRRGGDHAAYCGFVGDDVNGGIIVDALTAEDVVVMIRRRAGSTARAWVRLRDGDRTFLDSDRGVAEFRLCDIDRSVLADVDVVHTAYTGRLWMDAAELAARSPLSFDFGPHTGIDYRDEVVRHCLLASFSDANLDDNQVIDLAQHCRRLGAAHVMVTRGEQGADFFGPRGHVARRPDPAQLVDTLGAGDAFIAGVLAGLVNGTDPESFLDDAAARAAKCCSQLGGFGHGRSLDQNDPNDRLPTVTGQLHSLSHREGGKE